MITGHFFTTNTDWFVAEFDPATGDIYCFVILNDNFQNAEWGYSDLFGLESLNVRGVDGTTHIVERDLDWTPTRFADIARVRDCLR
jgi:hypothetical protein